MDNTGTIVTLSVPDAGSTVYSYVWDFWDGTSTATVDPSVAKLINIGGNPLTGDLIYACTPVTVSGQGTAITGTLAVNNPPTIQPGAQISNNDSFFPYSGTVKLSALDLEDDPLYFSWWSGATSLGNGVTVNAGTTAGTWAGNGTTVILDRTLYENALFVSVSSALDLTCYVSDSQGGTTALSFYLRGETPPPLETSISSYVQSLTFDASNLAQATIGPGETIAFSVYVTPFPGNTVSFSWNFSGSNNWTVPSTSPGTTTVYANGAVQNTVIKDISSEIITTGASKSVIAEVNVTAVNTSNYFTTSTTLTTGALLSSNPPVNSVSILRYLNAGSVAVSGLGPVNAGSLLRFSATGTDSASDLLTYFWEFDTADASYVQNAYGPKVVYDTTGKSSGASITGQLTVGNRYGSSLTASLPPTLIT